MSYLTCGNKIVTKGHHAFNIFKACSHRALPLRQCYRQRKRRYIDRQMGMQPILPVTVPAKSSKVPTANVMVILKVDVTTTLGVNRPLMTLKFKKKTHHFPWAQVWSHYSEPGDHCTSTLAKWCLILSKENVSPPVARTISDYHIFSRNVATLSCGSRLLSIFYLM